MKTNVYSSKGEKEREIELPKFFNEKIRTDILSKVLEARKRKQPYSPAPMAGRHHSASGIIQHRRHIWKTHYGMGISRIPRKIMSKKGSRFNWVGAEIPSTRGGRRAHPPKLLSMQKFLKVNKKEEAIALRSALIATATPSIVIKKYYTVSDAKVPIVVDSKIMELKTKQFLEVMKKILGNLYDVSISKKTVRAGIGKMRGR